MLLLVCQMSWENLIALLKGKIDLIYYLQMRHRHCFCGTVCPCVHLGLTQFSPDYTWTKGDRLCLTLVWVIMELSQRKDHFFKFGLIKSVVVLSVQQSV